MKKNTSYKALGLIFLIGVMVLLNSFLVGSADLNGESLALSDSIKSYDSLNQQITLINKTDLTKNIATIKLDTPLRNSVSYSNDSLIAEFTINSFNAEYTTPLEKIDSYNAQDLNVKYPIEYRYKLKGSKQVLIKAYNSTPEHYETITTWSDFNYSKLASGTYTIGIFTDTTKVPRYQEVEFIPTFFNSELTEFAVWVVEGHGIAFSGSGSYSGKWGSTIVPNKDIMIKALQKKNDCTATRGLIMFFNNTAMATASVTDNWANFSTPINLKANVVYAVTFDNSGSAYTNKYVGTTGNFPVVETDFTWANGTNPPYGGWYDTGTNDNVGCILALEYSLPDVIYNTSVTLNAPANASNFSTSAISFNVTAYTYNDGSKLTNVSLFIDEKYTESNTTTMNNGTTYIFTRTLTAGFHNWSINATDSNGSLMSAYRYFNITIYPPAVTLNSPTTNQVFNTTSVTFNVSVTDDFTLQNVTLFIDEVLNQTNTSGIEGTYLFNVNLSENAHTYRILAYDNDSNPTNSSTIGFYVDLSYPKINISYPLNTTYFLTNYTAVNNATIWFNWSVSNTPTPLSLCWWSNNSGATNRTITCNSNATYYSRFIREDLIAWANDTGGHLNVSRVSATFRAKLFENSRSVPAKSTEGSSQTYTLNLTNDEYPVTSAYLNYNGTRYSTSINTNSFTILTSTFAVPLVSANGNVTIFWELFISDGWINSTSSTMNVTNIAIDNCTTNKLPILNFTIVDEINQTKLLNSSAKLNLQIYPTGTLTEIINYTHYYNGTFESLFNPFAVCINASFLSGENYRIDTEVEYTAIGQATEFYHIQKETINNTYLRNITLYNLDNFHATTFKIIYKDSSYKPIEDALIQIKRKYIEEGIFKVSEIPLTDYNGETLASLQTNNVIYSFVVIKNGVILDTFSNLFVKCDNPLTDECIIPLNSIAPYVNTEDYTTGDDFSYSISYNRTTRVISVSYNIPSGNSSTIILNSTLTDNVGTIVGCTDTLTSSSGTLSCIVPNGIGNQSVIAYVYKDNVLQGYSIADMRQSARDIYGNNIFFLLIFLYLTIIGISIGDNPMVTGIFLVIGAVIGIAINLVNGSFIGRSATILWLVIAIVIVLIKGGRRT